MKITVRLVLSLLLAVASVAFVFSYLQVDRERQRLLDEMEGRARMLADSLEEPILARLGSDRQRELPRLTKRFGNRHRLTGVAVYDAAGATVAVTAGLGGEAVAATVMEALRQGRERAAVLRESRLHVYVWPLVSEGTSAGALAVFQPTAPIEERVARLWWNNFVRALVQVAIVTLVAMLVIRWSLAGPVARLAEWMRQMRREEGPLLQAPPIEDIFRPLAREAAQLGRSLTAARAAAEEEARLRVQAESLWTRERLKEHVKSRLQGRPLFVVSNREPYMHVRRGKAVECLIPASGMVTALDPVLRACGGMWVAHGAGDADRGTVDARDQVQVPPEDPRYTLRRVWLTTEEEQGYYYGFSNEGLWPLCHIVHMRPAFRAEDWAQYQAANRKFAETVLEELEGAEAPCVLVQDYHFALLPRLVKSARPDARVAIFWHIPWPNPEAFGICPWAREVLDGMLGADVVAFHTQYHCNNFLDTVDRTLECRLDWERFAVRRGGQTTLVKPFPIGIAPTDEPAAPAAGTSGLDKAAIFRALGVKADLLAVGVDRLDYTKGILERLRGLERCLERFPELQGRLCLVQIAAPSREHIGAYQRFGAEVDGEVERINRKFQTKGWRPVVYLKRHHSHAEILPYFRAADACLVTSLHDGMNLVAKEFIAARQDEDGVLILSRFTGAARELRDALLVNPYDTEQTAEALRAALEMEPEERRARMQRLRQVIRENNVYRWAGLLVKELTDIRLPTRPVSAA